MSVKEREREIWDVFKALFTRRQDIFRFGDIS